jgi:hypothetical protein
MSGLRLSQMEMSEMLDVIHYIFEEDLHFSTGEQAEAQTGVRKSLYKELYGKDYKYNRSSGKRKTANGFEDIEGLMEEEKPVVPLDPVKESKKVKGYTPATTVNAESPLPFGNVLDAPIG